MLEELCVCNHEKNVHARKVTRGDGNGDGCYVESRYDYCRCSSFRSSGIYSLRNSSEAKEIQEIYKELRLDIVDNLDGLDNKYVELGKKLAEFFGPKLWKEEQ